MIYFVSNETRSAIKIGYIASISRFRVRLIELQIANVDKIKVISVIDGTLNEEQRLHRHFKKFHRRGEWFHDCYDIREYAASYTNFYDEQKHSRKRKRVYSVFDKIYRLTKRNRRIIREMREQQEREELERNQLEIDRLTAELLEITAQAAEIARRREMRGYQ